MLAIYSVTSTDEEISAQKGHFFLLLHKLSLHEPFFLRCLFTGNLNAKVLYLSLPTSLSMKPCWDNSSLWWSDWLGLSQALSAFGRQHNSESPLVCGLGPPSLTQCFVLFSPLLTLLNVICSTSRFITFLVTCQNGSMGNKKARPHFSSSVELVSYVESLYKHMCMATVLSIYTILFFFLKKKCLSPLYVWTLKMFPAQREHVVCSPLVTAFRFKDFIFFLIQVVELRKIMLYT